MANIVLSILGNDRTGDATRSATQNLTGVQKLAQNAGRIAAGVGLAAAAGVGAILKTGFDEAKDGSAGLAQLEAGVKSTGGAAGVTVQHMADLASSIQGMSGQTDDSIVSAQKLLLTFTGIKNTKTDKIFDDATLAAANMAAKLGGDASTQAMALGKALNDPEKGITKLTKVGVTFTEAQKEQVAAMVKAGDTAGAQKVILSELNTEFGGAAKAAGGSLPGQLARAQRAFEDLSQGVVEALLPIMSAVLPTLIAGIKTVSPAFQDVAKWITANKDLIPGLIGVVALLAGGLGALMLASKVATAATLLFGTAQEAGAIKTAATTIALGAQKAAVAASTAVQWLFNAAMSANPIGLVVIAIVALIAIIVLLVTHWSDVVAFLKDVWGGIVTWFQGTLTAIGKWWSDTWTGIVGFFKTVLAGAVQLFQNWTLIGIIASHWTEIVAGAKTAWGILLKFIGGVPKAILDFFTGIGKWLYDAGSDLLDGLLDGGKKGLLALGRWEMGIGDTVIGWVSDAGTWLVDTGVRILRGALSGAKTGLGALSDWFGGLQDRVGGWLGDVGGWLYKSGRSIVQGLIDGITSKINAAGSAVSGVLSHIASFFPNSPAERGPFSGRGWSALGDSGAAIVDQISGGFTSRAAAAGGQIGSAMTAFMPTRGAGMGMNGGGGSAPLVHIDTFNATPEQSPADIAAGLGWLTRGGL